MPATFLPSTQTSFGHFTQRARPGDVGHREPGAQRQQVVELAQDQRSGDRDAGRRRPAAALAAAAGGLLVGRDQRAVRGALLGQFTRALVGRADRLVVLAGFSEAHGADVTASASSAAIRPSGVCGSASRSGSQPSPRSSALVAGPIETSRGPSSEPPAAAKKRAEDPT